MNTTEKEVGDSAFDFKENRVRHYILPDFCDAPAVVRVNRPQKARARRLFSRLSGLIFPPAEGFEILPVNAGRPNRL